MKKEAFGEKIPGVEGCEICKDMLEVVEDESLSLAKRYKKHLKELHRRDIVMPHTYGKCKCGLDG